MSARGGKKRHTGESALRRLFPNCVPEALHKTQAVVACALLLSASSSAAAEEEEETTLPPPRIKRNVVEWADFAGDAAVVSAVQRFSAAAANKAPSSSFAAVSASVSVCAVGCCAAESVLGRIDPREAFVVVRLCPSSSSSSSQQSEQQKQQRRRLWNAIALRRADGAVVSDAAAVLQRLRALSDETTASAAAAAVILPMAPKTTTTTTTAEDETTEGRMKRLRVCEKTSPEEEATASSVSSLQQQHHPRCAHEWHQRRAEAVWAAAFGSSGAAVGWDAFSAWLRSRCADAAADTVALGRLRELLLCSGCAAAASSASSFPASAAVTCDRWTLFALVFRSRPLRGPPQPHTEAAAAAAATMSERFISSSSIDPAAGGDIDVGGVAVHAAEDPREAFAVHEAAVLVGTGFHGVLGRADADAVLAGETADAHSGLFRLSESSRGFLVLTRRLPAQHVAVTRRPSVVHTLVGKHVAGEKTLALQGHTGGGASGGNERTTYDVDVVPAEDAFRSFWYEVASERGDGCGGHFSTLAELVDARALLEGLPPCKMLMRASGYDDLTASGSHQQQRQHFFTSSR